MDQGLRNFISSQKSLVLDTKIASSKKQKTTVPKASEAPDRSLDPDPFKRFAVKVVKDKLNKKEVVEHFQKFIEEAEARL
jgi:hypothetical protein